MAEAAFRETTTPLMRPHQVESMRDEARALQATLAAPAHIASAIQGRGDVLRHLKSIERDLETQEPRAYALGELDAAVGREAELQAEILAGMPTQAEMRRNPAGAVDKHRAWETRNKSKILEWKNIRLRLHSGGYLDDAPDARDVANLERFRPVGGAQELNMHGEQIPGTIVKLPPPGAGPAAVMSESQAALLKSINPELHDQMGLMNNEQRAAVLELVDRYAALGEASQVGKGAGEAQVRAKPVHKRKKARRAKGPKRPRSAKQLASDARLSEVMKSRNAARSADKAVKEG